MPLLIALLGFGVGALAVFVTRTVVHELLRNTDDLLREMRINPGLRQSVLAAHQEADRLVSVAESGPSRPTAQQLEAASQANQIAARKTAEYAEAIDRFTKSGRTHPNLESIRNDVATMTQIVEWRGRGIEEIRKGTPPQPTRAPAKPSKSPRAQVNR